MLNVNKHETLEFRFHQGKGNNIKAGLALHRKLPCCGVKFQCYLRLGDVSLINKRLQPDQLIYSGLGLQPYIAGVTSTEIRIKQVSLSIIFEINVLRKT